MVIAAFGFSPAAGYAAGLGRLTIHSAIGQPLVADIELVSVRPEELSTLAARVAPPDAFRNANINFNPALVGARATIERRPGGIPYIRVTSNRPIDEPYIDLLVELTWNTGRLVREYTALIDPPGFGGTQVATPSPVRDSTPAAAAPVPAPAAAPAAAAQAGTGERTYGPVQPGDTLRKIAVGVKPEGVNLDQVLVGIFRSNPDAFIDNNMNLLRTGRILRIPDAAEISQISGAEAGKEVRLHTQNWNAYRARVTGAVPEVPGGEGRAAAGRITTRVDEPGAAQPPGKEVVKVSKGAPGAAPGGTTERDLQERIRVLEEEATAREKTLKDANERIASLEKTLKDMQRLLEMKGVPTPPPVAVAPPPAEKAALPEPPAEAAKPEAAPPAPPAEAKPEPKPEPKAEAPAPKPVEKKAAPPAPPPPPPAPEWWEDPTLLGGALVALGLVGGLAYVMARRRRSSAAEPVEPTLRTPPSTGAVAGAAAAAATPVADATTEMPAVAATAPAAVDDVDPIQEADVYIAYGRDAQAEEILKEALAKDPNRQEIRLKLLEIYAARKSRNDFNALAEDLHKATHGRGDLWLKAATMGFALDPENPLYAAGKDSTIVTTPVGVATDVNLDFDLDMVTATGAPTTVTDVPLDTGEDQTVKTMALSPERMEALRAEGAASGRAPTDTHPIVPDIDLTDVPTAPRTDITLERPTGPITDVNLEVPRAATDSNVIDFEFDPGKTVKIDPAAAPAFDQTVVISPENQEKARDLGIEIDLASLDAAPTIPQGSPTPPAQSGTSETTADISFDFQLPAESPPTAEVEVPPTDIKLDVPESKPADTTTIDFTLDTVSLDLGGAGKPAEAAAAPQHDDHWYDVQTKFDLAKAYQEMGDKEGAREILAEVIKEGDAQQQAEANELLAKL